MKDSPYFRATGLLLLLSIVIVVQTILAVNKQWELYLLLGFLGAIPCFRILSHLVDYYRYVKDKDHEKDKTLHR